MNNDIRLGMEEKPRLFPNRLHHLGMAMTEDHRAPGTDVIDIALAVGIPEIGTFGTRDEAWCAADRAEGAQEGEVVGDLQAARQHDIALTGAFREALAAVLEKLNPESIEEQLGRRAQGVAD